MPRIFDEILLQDQIYSYFRIFFQKLQNSLRKRYNKQDYLLVMTKKMRKFCHKIKRASQPQRIYQNHLTVYNIIFLLPNHMLFVIVQYLYTSSIIPILVPYPHNSHLRKRLILKKLGSFYSEIIDIIFGAAQDSIITLLLFNINTIELFLIGQ